MLPFFLKLCLNLAMCCVLYNTNTSKTLQKKKKKRICTFVQVCAKRFRLCPTYKATSDKGSLLASYYFSKIAQSKKQNLKRKRTELEKGISFLENYSRCRQQKKYTKEE